MLPRQRLSCSHHSGELADTGAGIGSRSDFLLYQMESVTSKKKKLENRCSAMADSLCPSFLFRLKEVRNTVPELRTGPKGQPSMRI